MPLSLAFSPCPNDTFIFHAMVSGAVPFPGPEAPELEIHLGDVEELNSAAMEARHDVTKLSYAALSACSHEYALLHAGSALGRGVGPLLVAREPIAEEDFGRLTVAIPGERTTANFLLNWAWPDIRRKEELLFSDIEDAVLSGRVDAGLLIHENRFTYADRGLALLADLGSHWELKTGLPIPLGGIVARRSLGTDQIQQIDTWLKSSVDYAFRNPEASRDYVQAHAQEMDPEVQRQHIGLYVNDYSLDLGRDGEAAVRHLLRASGAEPERLFG